VDEHAALNKILTDAFGRGLRYLTDQDARPAGSSSSLAHLWDSGGNTVDELDRLMKVRAAALNRFGENNIREGAPMATLEDVLVPLYMYHRYQVEAAAKLVGGEDYAFSLRGKGDRNPQIIPAEEQRRALSTVLDTLKPEALALAESLLRLIPPRPPGYPRTREDFRIRTSPNFDGLAPAEAFANHVCDSLFNPERAARLVEFHARDPRYPGWDEVLDTILAATWKARIGSTKRFTTEYEAEVQRTVNMVVLTELMSLAANDHASNQVRAIAEYRLSLLRDWAVDPARSDERRRTTRFHRLCRKPDQALSGRPKENEPHEAQ